MLKNFKVTTKIALGFGMVLILLAFTAGQGIIRLEESSEGFTSYRNLARHTNLAGRIQANLLMMRMGAVTYITSDKQEALEHYNDRFAQSEKFIKEAQAEIKTKESLKHLNELQGLIITYDKAFNEFQAHKKIEKESISLTVKNGQIITDGLNTLLESATEREDNYMMAMVQKSRSVLLAARLANSNFIYNTKTEADANKAIKAFDEFQKTLQAIQNILYSPADLGLINELEENNKQYINYTRKIIESKMVQEKASKKIYSLGPVLAEQIENMKLGIMQEQDKLGPKMQSAIASAVSNMTFMSALTLVAGALLAFFIARSITVPLKKASIYVKELAKGNLDSRMEVNQKDEVGMICQDMALVGRTLNDVISEIDTAITDIEEGRIDSQADSKNFHGSFALLIDRTNLATSVLKSFIDAVPMPLTTMDKDMNILFMNKSGTGLLGKSLNEMKGGKCSKFINAADCGTPSCVCAKAISSNSIQHGSTIVKTPSGDLYIDYTAVPITKNGKVVGTIKVVQDQTEIKTAQMKMQDVAERTQAISEQLSSASEELAAQVEQISQGSENQRERIVETATAMEQMNSTIMEVAHNASNASSKTLEARQQAEDGAAIVSESVKSITEVSSIAEDLRRNMASLNEQTESISTVMDVISDIADQTNLLALNAAIEAARAGEAGRGFAVVADEVRKLAEKTMTATHEVGTSIENIQKAVRMNMHEVESAVSAVDETTELANKSGSSLEAIVSTVDYSARQVEGIAAAAEEQSSASEQINGAITEINNVARETTEGIRQSAQAVQELAVMSSELSELINELRAK